MISKLTAEQEALIPSYVEKWRAVGINTKPIDRAKCVSILERLFVYRKFNKPSEVAVFDGTSDAYKEALKDSKNFTNKFVVIFYDNPMQIVAEAKANNINLSYLDFAQTDAYWFSFYNYIIENLDVKYDKELVQLTYDLITECGPFYTFEGGVCMADRPEVLSFNAQHQLHNPNGPARKFRNEPGKYYLNGTEMPSWLWEVEKSQLDPKKILAITNVEQRTAAMKWYGLETFLNVLGHTIVHKNDAKGYQLLNVNIGNNMTGKYLRMVNPSTGEIHVEGVANECMTIEDAMRSRTPAAMVKKYGFSMPLRST